MHFTLQTDLALRVLLALALDPDQIVSAPAIARAYGASVDHVTKVAKSLVQKGYVESKRGRQGGLKLARPLADIRVGDVVRDFEPLDLLDCFDNNDTSCVLSPACKLKAALRKATKAFVSSLDALTLEELVHNQHQLARLLPLENLVRNAS
ncbi:MAG: Rrf2 family transcriptional regulator [Polyangiaceae bacterium]